MKHHQQKKVPAGRDRVPEGDRIPIDAMGRMVYIPTWMVYFYYVNYRLSHGSVMGNNYLL